MAISKIIYKENAEATPVVWMDTTDKTADSGNMLNGITALKNDGTTATGNIASKTSSDLTASGATVTAPAGYYASAATKSVAAGSVTAPSTISGSNATITASTSNNTITLTKSVSSTPNVTTEGYISNGTAGSSSVSLQASIPVYSGAVFNPSTTMQTIPAGYYTTDQYISGVGCINLTPENIKAGVTVRVYSGYSTGGQTIASVTGTYTGSTTYTVTVSLTNPVNGYGFGYCSIRELDSQDGWGAAIGSISSPTGSTDVIVDGSKYGIGISIVGASMDYGGGTVTTTGDVSYNGYNWTNYDYVFQVTGDGTVTLDGLDYDD